MRARVMPSTGWRAAGRVDNDGGGRQGMRVVMNEIPGCL